MSNLSGLSLTTDLKENNSTRTIPMGLHTNTYSWGGVTDSLGCQFFAGGFAPINLHAVCYILRSRKKAKDLEREALRVITKSCMITPKELPSPLSTVWCAVVVSIKETSGVLKVLLENVIPDAVTYTVMDFIYALKRQLSPYKFYTLLKGSFFSERDDAFVISSNRQT